MDARHGGQGGSVRGLQALVGLAARQHSVFSRQQALAVGVTTRMIARRTESGVWVRVHRSVYRLAGAVVTPQQRVVAACLAAGPGAAASHRCAAAVWGIDGFALGRVEVSVVGPRRLVAGATVHRPRRLAQADLAETDAIPLTTVARTLIDLASVVDDHDLEAAIDWGLREQRVTVGYLRRRLAALGAQGRAGSGRLQALLDDRERRGPFESRREAQLARMLVAAGLPVPVRQFRLLDRAGKPVARFDLALPEARIAFEFDSYRYHYGRQAWRRDVGRSNRAAAEGWLVLVFTENDLTDPDLALCAQVLTTYHARLAA